MKFSTKEDIEVPIEACFDMVTDFEVYERAGLRRGADVVRVDSLRQPGVGAAWNVKADFRGRTRKFDIEVAEYDAPSKINVGAQSGGMLAGVLVELVALSPNRTRMRVELDVKPKTLSARLLLQSAKLARNRLNKRYKNRVAHFAADLEERHKRRA